MDDFAAGGANNNNGIGAKTAQDEEIDLRAAVQYAVMQIIQQEDSRSLLTKSKTTTRIAAINSIAELTFLYATQCTCAYFLGDGFMYANSSPLLCLEQHGPNCFVYTFFYNNRPRTRPCCL
jgi:hypothetical protein